MTKITNQQLTILDLMNDVEKEGYRKFWEDHRLCPFTSTIGGKISVEVTGTGLGYGFVCKCNACGTEKDITDTNSW